MKTEPVQPGSPPSVVLAGHGLDEISWLKEKALQIRAQVDPVFLEFDLDAPNWLTVPSEENIVWLSRCDFSCQLPRCINRLYSLKNLGCRQLCLLRPLLPLADHGGFVFCSHFSFATNGLFSAAQLARLFRGTSFHARNRFLCWPQGDAARRILEIQEFILEGEGNAWKRKQLAEKFQVSETWLSNCFRRYAGVDLKTYLEKVKICRSLEMALFEEMPMKMISRRLGYRDYRTFWRFIRSRLGQTLLSLR